MVLFGLSGLRFHRPEPAGRQLREEERHTFQVIEVPAEIREEKPTEPTNLVSDRVARAAEMNLEDMEESADPYSDGDTEVREFEEIGADVAQARPEAVETEPDRREGHDEQDEGDRAADVVPEEIADYVVDEGDAGRNGTPGRPLIFRNLLSDVGRKGGLSFNTYDWDFAPYMLAMKRAIENHLFPPYAFTHMGMVSGTNMVRFTVMPNGRIRGLEILGSDAHFSLDRTSVRAIESSVPFLPLPRDFPKEYLEVTAHFSYVIHGRD